MTSVRTCYCKHEGNVARKKDNDIRIHNGNRQPATAASKKSIVTSKTWNPCGSDRESRKRAKCVTNEETVLNINNFIYLTLFGHSNILFTMDIARQLQPGTSRPVEAQPSNLILSPETSIALENAEKIISNAKMQLIEVCATSSFDSARRNRNTWVEKKICGYKNIPSRFIEVSTVSSFNNCDCSRKTIFSVTSITTYYVT